MWVKKTPAEIEQARRRNNKENLRTKLLMHSIVFLVLMASVTISLKTGVWKGLRREPKAWGEVFILLPKYLLVVLIVTVVVFHFIKNRSLTKKKSLICPKCGKSKHENGTFSCECGGHFEDINTMKWVD